MSISYGLAGQISAGSFFLKIFQMHRLIFIQQSKDSVNHRSMILLKHFY